MPRDRCRPPNLGDIMILVVAAAVGFAALHSMMDPSPWFTPAQKIMGPAVLLLGPVSLGLLLIRLRPPRPRFVRIFRQPGAAASMLAAVMISLWLAFAARSALQRSREFGDEISYLGVAVGPAVLAAWVVLWGTRTGRCERSWIDRAGRLLGVLWIADLALTLYEVLVN